MSYSAGEALVLACVRTCTGYDANNTSRANWKLLNKGKAANYAILRPGPMRFTFETMTMYVARYTTIVECWRRYTTDGDSQANLYADVNNILVGLMPEKLLNSGGTIRDASVLQVDEPEEMWRKGGGPAWLRTRVHVQWQEESVVTFTD